MAKYGIGQSVPRKEDPRLVTGAGEYTADVNVADQLHMAIVRSPDAHGRIESLDISQARAQPGVVAVYVAQDLSAVGVLPCRAVVQDADGNDCFIPPRHILASKVVRFAGQAVAAVVADTLAQAHAAAELVILEVDELPTVVDPAQALSVDSPIVHPQHGSNLSVHWQNGDATALANALQSAPHVVSVALVNNRVVPSPLEPRTCVATYDSDGFTVYNPSQGPVAQQGVLAKVFGVTTDHIRVISGDTGGGFGVRGEIHPESCLCLFAARELSKPVKWVGTRSEMFLADSHGRDNVTEGTIALDKDGRILGVGISTFANLGAYCSAVGPFVPTMAGGRITGTVYRIPALHQSVRCVFTNTMPVAAYRGAGRPEACYIMERLIEAASVELGLSSIELRLKNFIRPADLPFKNHSGVMITSGNFAQTLEKGLLAAHWSGFEERKLESAARGLNRGIGLGYYTESSGGGVEEEAKVTLRADGGVDAVIGTFSHGQGHKTTYSQIIADTLGVDFADVNIIQGDTREVKFGGGTGGSRSSQMGGMAVLQGSRQVADSGKPIAAELLQTPIDQVTFSDGSYRAAESGAEIALAEVARAAREPQFTGALLCETVRYQREAGWTFPNGAHVAEVEVDPDTGVIDVVRYTAVDDCGRVLNPLLAAGQVHGGVAQGLGQALFEAAIYDEQGQLLTGSLMDYVIPRASQLPDIDVSFNEVLEPTNELGVKGIGEGGACGAPPALVHAVHNALADYFSNGEVAGLDMPLTSEKVLRAIGRL